MFLEKVQGTIDCILGLICITMLMHPAELIAVGNPAVTVGKP